jgi:serine/threonine protein kinase
MIGPYKLLQQIGEGGMGVVWMAEQTQPVQRKVALKVIKPGMDSRQVIARFEAERQALAMMDHVNIARVFDGGATESGRPYFVMELVHGVPITKYCDDNHLTPRERLELFVPVCQAIQHAHQKGIIHRDIKPSNVMVTLYDGKPVPKVIDFGVAKATEQTLTERTLFTQYGTMVGTLEYMSPEQAEMSALGVDTRSDIYSLGVLLYELLTGSTPLTHKRMKEAAFAEILRMIREEEPPRPSTRLSDSGEALASISVQRHMEPAKLTKLVRGELDWIVMKTLEKDRNRRYETAIGLADDVRRYLNDEQVLACPPSRWYRFRKFARRNRRTLASAVFLGVVLLLAVVGLAVSNRLIDQERAETAAERDRTKAANAQLKENLQLALQALDEVYFRLTADRMLRDPRQQKEDDVFLKHALTFYERFAAQNSDDPDVRYEMSRAYSRVGSIHSVLHQRAPAKKAHLRALAIAEQLAADYPKEPKYRANLGTMLFGVTGGAGAEDAKMYQQRAFDLRKQLAVEFPEVLAYREDLADAHNSIAWNLVTKRDPAAAVPHYREAIVLWTRLVDEGSHASKRRLAGVQLNLGSALTTLNDPASVEYYRKAIPIYADLVAEMDRPNEVPRAGREATPGKMRRALATAHRLLGRQLMRWGDPDAEKHLAQSVAIQMEAVADSPNVPSYRDELAMSQIVLGDVLLAGKRPAEAEKQCRQAMINMTELVGAHGDVILYRARLAVCHIALGNVNTEAGEGGAAAEHYRQARDLYEELMKKAPKDTTPVRDLALLLGNCLDPKSRDPARAVRLAKQLVEMSPLAGDSWSVLGVAYYRAGDWKAAVLALEKGAALANGGTNRDWIYLAMVHGKLDDPKQARRYYDRAVQRMPSDVNLQYLRAEAAALLGIELEQKTSDAPGLPKN